MEIVAMDMKVRVHTHTLNTVYRRVCILQLRGMYIARQLSFSGVTFDVREVSLADKFIEMYDSSVEMVSFYLQCICYAQSANSKTCFFPRVVAQ